MSMFWIGFICGAAVVIVVLVVWFLIAASHADIGVGF